MTWQVLLYYCVCCNMCFLLIGELNLKKVFWWTESVVTVSLHLLCMCLLRKEDNWIFRNRVSTGPVKICFISIWLERKLILKEMVLCRPCVHLCLHV